MVWSLLNFTSILFLSSNFIYGPEDIEWNHRNTIVFPSLCVVAGVLAGLLGIGGGVVKGPLMLEMGVNPLVASATSATMIFFTSLCAISSYVVLEPIMWDYTIFAFLLGLATTYFGHELGMYFVRRYNRLSLITLSIGAVVAISAILMTAEQMIMMRA